MTRTASFPLLVALCHSSNKPRERFIVAVRILTAAGNWGKNKPLSYTKIVPLLISTPHGHTHGFNTHHACQLREQLVRDGVVTSGNALHKMTGSLLRREDRRRAFNILPSPSDAGQRP